MSRNFVTKNVFSTILQLTHSLARKWCNSKGRGGVNIKIINVILCLLDGDLLNSALYNRFIKNWLITLIPQDHHHQQQQHNDSEDGREHNPSRDKSRYLFCHNCRQKGMLVIMFSFFFSLGWEGGYGRPNLANKLWYLLSFPPLPYLVLSWPLHWF